MPDASVRARYERLSLAAAAGAVPDDLVAALETMLELLFETGRVSNRGVLQSIFGRTPRGRSQSAAVRKVNRALETLRGQEVRNVRLSSSGPSQRSLSIETDGCRLVLDFSRGGATITTLEVA